ncbi:ARC3 [Acrasis kona]|uniref:ARC3 n=1 Tax=Acrasis kona TaxID=1008807 RepID=A0AAW2YIL6_9EUKA
MANSPTQEETRTFPLHSAARAGDIETLNRLLADGHKVDELNWAGVTALHEACLQGHTEVVTKLLDVGANIDIQTAAVENEQYDVAYHLTERGARVDIKDERSAKNKSSSYKMTQLFSLYISSSASNSPSTAPDVSQTDDFKHAATPERLKLQRKDTPIFLFPNAGEKYTETTYEVPGLGKHHYVGTVDINNKKTGRGELHYPNNTSYEGEFLDDKRHGFGKFMITKSPDGQLYVAIGQWHDNYPCEDVLWKMTQGQWHYFGFISFPRQKRKNSKREEILIEMHHLQKHKQGELHDTKSNFKYFGSFCQDKRSGFGVCTFGNADRYYGKWKEDLIHGFGKFSKGRKKGKGTLYTSSGDSIDGMWDGDKITAATYSRGTCESCPTSMLHDAATQITSCLRRRENEGVISRPYDTMCSFLNPSKGPQTTEKWRQYFVLHKEQWDRNVSVIFNSIEKSESKNADVNGLYFEVMWGKEDGNTILRKTANSLLLHAKDDVKSFVDFIDSLLSDFFMEAFNILIVKNKNDKKRVDMLTQQRVDACHMVPSSVVRHVLAKAHNTIFPLYEIYYEESDLIVNQCIESITSECTLQRMGVHRRFIPDHEETPYNESILLLEKLNQERTVSNKLSVLSNVRKLMLMEIRNIRKANKIEDLNKQNVIYSDEMRQEDDSWQPGADDCVGVYSYVFLKSRVRNHYAQFHYINDWMHEEMHSQPVAHTLAFYEGFLEYVKDLDPNLVTEEGEFVNVQTIARSLERSIQKAKSVQKETHTFIHWIPALLSRIGLDAGGLRIRSQDQTPSSPSTTCVVASLVITEPELSKNLIKNFEVVEQIVSDCYSCLGFDIKKRLQKDSGQPQIIVEFGRTYPSHVYSQLGLLMTRFIRFDLEE